MLREEGGLIFSYAPCAVPRPGQVAPIDSPITGYVVAYSTLELTTVGGGAGAGGVGGGAGGTRERWERGEVVVAENVANPAVTLRGLRADTQYVSCAGAVCSAFKLMSRPSLPSCEWGGGMGRFSNPCGPGPCVCGRLLVRVAGTVSLSCAPTLWAWGPRASGRSLCGPRGHPPCPW